MTPSTASRTSAEIGNRRSYLSAAPDPDAAAELLINPAPVPMVSLLDLDGNRVTHPDYESGLSDEQILAAYRDLVMARRLDIEGTNLQRQGQLALGAVSRPGRRAGRRELRHRGHRLHLPDLP